MMLKKVYLVFLVFTFYNSSFSQTSVDFGLKGGLNLTFFNVVESNFGPNATTETGFYGGGFLEFKIDEAFSIQPEVLYIQLNDFEFINAPIYAKYEVASKLSILVGPSLNYFFDFFTNKFKVRADISSAYNITNSLDVHIKYTLGFQEITPNGLFFGLGYKL